MPNEKPALITPQEQLSIIKSVRDFYDYDQFYEKSFSPDGWTDAVNAVLQTRSHEIKPDQPYFQFMTLISLLFLQHGFVSMGGHFNRHRHYKWKESPISRRHLLALASYGGNANNQTFPIRTAWEKDLASVIPDEVSAVWGLGFNLNRGQITNHKADLNAVKRAAISRWKDPDPIYLPTQEINRQLAELNFSGHDADQLPKDQLVDKILPQARKILTGVLDADQLLTADFFEKNYPTSR
jgi:hypothetical protein